MFLWDSDSDSGPKEPGFRLQLQNVVCDILIVYFIQDECKEDLNSYNKGAQGCTIVYKQNFHCNCTIKE